MPICAYCRQDRTLTREHIIPAFLYNFQRQLDEGATIGWNEVAQRMVGGEAKVRDVCAECNGGYLSDLDAYAKRVLSESGLLVANFTRSRVTIKHDYAMLLRWLLKVSFNSTRQDRVHSPLFEPHVPFIMGDADLPPRHRVACLIGLAAPARLEDTTHVDRETFLKRSNGHRLFNPFVVRISYGAVRGEDRYVLRLVILGAAVFYLLMFHDDTLPGHAGAAIRAFLKTVPGSVELTTKLRLVEVATGQKTWLELYENQVQRANRVDPRSE
jgi:hypothetical protein